MVHRHRLLVDYGIPRSSKATIQRIARDAVRMAITSLLNIDTNPDGAPMVE